MSPFRIRFTSNKIKQELNQIRWSFEDYRDRFVINEDSVEKFIYDLSRIATRVNFQIIDDEMVISEQYELMMKAMSNPPPRQSSKCPYCGK